MLNKSIKHEKQIKIKQKQTSITITITITIIIIKRYSNNLVTMQIIKTLPKIFQSTNEYNIQLLK